MVGLASHWYRESGESPAGSGIAALMHHDGGSASVDGGNGVGKFSRGRDFGAISHLLVDRRLQVAFVMLARLGLSLPRSGVISLSLQKAASPHFLNGAAGENQCYYYSQPCDRLPTHKTCQ